jgi:hypothetical protein
MRWWMIPKESLNYNSIEPSDLWHQAPPTLPIKPIVLDCLNLLVN